MGACAMCHASDCVQLRASPLDVCPVYFGLRDALFPKGGNLDGRCALALFWISHRLGELALNERRSILGDLKALFSFALQVASEPTFNGEQ
jgi:hypothetical protein